VLILSNNTVFVLQYSVLFYRRNVIHTFVAIVAIRSMQILNINSADIQLGINS